MTKTLGVLRFYTEVLLSIRDRSRFIFVVEKVEDFDGSFLSRAYRKEQDILVSKQDWNPDTIDDSWLELMAHQFQSPVTPHRRIMILHDLHIFTIPWKYGDSSKGQEKIRENYLESSATITQFPYSYFYFKEIVGESPTKLFLTPSPLMIDLELARSAARGEVPDIYSCRSSNADTITLFYPAQFQAHKNHRLLWRVVKKLSETLSVRCYVTGTGFKDSLSEQIFADAEVLGVRDLIQDLGVVPEQALASLFRYADVTVIPTLAEGGAYVALEAIACGGRVACSNIEQAVMHLRMSEALQLVTLFDPWNLPNAVSAVLRARDAAPSDPRQFSLQSWSQYGEALEKFIDFAKGDIRRPRVMINGQGRLVGYAE